MLKLFAGHLLASLGRADGPHERVGNPTFAADVLARRPARRSRAAAKRQRREARCSHSSHLASEDKGSRVARGALAQQRSSLGLLRHALLQRGVRRTRSRSPCATPRPYATSMRLAPQGQLSLSTGQCRIPASLTSRPFHSIPFWNGRECNAGVAVYRPWQAEMTWGFVERGRADVLAVAKRAWLPCSPSS